MKAIKSVILAINRFIPLKQTLVALLISFILLIIIDTIWEGSVSNHINTSDLRIAAIVLGVISVWVNRGKANTGLIFISAVIWLAIPQLIKIVMYFEEFPTTSLHIYNSINIFNPIVITIGAIAGMIYVHRNRDKITGVFKKTENGENISKNRNLLYRFFPLILVMITLALTLPGLGSFDFREDEFQVVGSAAGYYHTGDYYQWDWLTNAPSETYYDRAWPHTFMVAESYHLFGISEWSSRIVSVIWFTIFILAAYFVAKKIINKNFAFLFAVIIAMCTSYLFWARYTRMYMVFIPVFFVAVCFLYRGLFTGKPHTKFRIISGLRINYLYLILGGLLFYFSYLIHLNTLIYFIGFFIFLLIWMCKNRYWAYLKPVGIMIVSAIVLLFVILFTDISLSATASAGLPDTPRYDYITYLFQYPFGVGITMVLLIAGVPIFWRKSFLIYSLILPVSALTLLVFFTTRYSLWAYISNFTPFVILLSAICLYFFITVFFKEKLLYKFTLIFISLFIIISGFCLEVPSIYEDASGYGHFKDAYEIINENYTEDEVIIGQYLRTYYIDPVKTDEVQTASMLSYQQWTFDDFMNTINEYKSGWITWETRKWYHIRSDISQYIDEYFIKIHGDGYDNTKVEVYYFNLSDTGN